MRVDNASISSHSVAKRLPRVNHSLPSPMNRPFTLFMLLKAHPAWNALGRPAQDALRDETLSQVYDRFPSTRLRCYDAASFHSRCTEVVVWETTDMAEYHFAVDSLRETAFFRPAYFDIVDLVPSVPDGWREFDWDTAPGVVA